MAVSRVLNVPVTGDSRGFERAIGRASQASGKFAKSTEQTHARIRKSFMGITASAAKAGAGFAAAYVSIAGAKEALTTTEELAKTTLALHKNLGFAVDEASRWAAVARARGVDTSALSASFTQLSRSVESARGGGEKTAKAFRELGLTQSDLKEGQRDFQGLIVKVSDGLSGMEGGTHRAALAQQILGRAGQTTLPIFTAGSKALREQLALADKYGVTLKGHTVKSVEDLVKAQREAEFATMGLQVAVGTQLAPVLTKVIGSVAKFAAQMRDGTGAGGKFAAVLKTVGDAFKIVGKAAEAGFGAVHKAVGTTVNSVRGFLHRHEDDVKAVAKAFRNLGVAVREVFEHVILPVVRRVMPGVTATVKGALQALGGVIRVFSGVLTGNWSKAWGGLKGITSGVLKGVVGLVRVFTSPMREAASRLGQVFSLAFKAALNGLVSFFRGRINDLLGVVNTAISAYNKIPLAPNIGTIGKIGGGGGGGGVRNTTVPGVVRGGNRPPAAVPKTTPSRPAHGTSIGNTGIVARASSVMASAASAGPVASAASSKQQIADTIVAVGRSMGASDKEILAAIEAGIVESGLQNLPYGDRDSVGVFQQRPSQGWTGLMNVPKAAAEFFQHAKRVNSAGLTAGQLAQAVQRSAFPARYDAVRGQAQAILGGVRSGGGLRSISVPSLPKPKVQTRYDKLQNRLDYIDLQVQAGVISQGVGDQAIIDAVNRALPHISGADRLRAMAARREAQHRQQERRQAAAQTQRQQAAATRKAKTVDPTIDNPYLQAYLAHQDYLLASGGFDAQAAAQGVTPLAIANANKTAALRGALPGLRSEADKTTALGMIADLTAAPDDTTTGDDPNQPLIDALAAQTEAANAVAETQRALQESLDASTRFAGSVTATQLGQTMRALADFINGQIYGNYGMRAATASSGGIVRY